MMGQAFVLMNNPRRKFIRMGAMLGAGAAFMPLQFCSPAKREEEAGATLTPAEPERTGTPLSVFGIQLYSVKEEMAKDAAATMKTLAGYGYKQFEGFDGGKGILWGMKPAEFKSVLDDTGVSFISSHANVFENLEAQAGQAAEVGMKYLICPWIGPQKSLDAYKSIADKFNEVGEKLKSQGLRFAYHNHDYTFKTQDGALPQDILMEHTDPALVDFEMDIYWVHVAGINPGDYMAKYPGRFKLCHLKDAEAGSGNPGERGVLLGAGEIPYADLIKMSQERGMEYFVVEQERFVDVTPFQAAERNAQYLKALVI